MLVESDHNLFVAKMFLTYTIITKKVFGDLEFNLLCYMYVFLFYSFFDLRRQNKILFHSFKK